jgi:hypothetical protein
MLCVLGMFASFLTHWLLFPPCCFVGICLVCLLVVFDIQKLLWTFTISVCLKGLCLLLRSDKNSSLYYGFVFFLVTLSMHLELILIQGRALFSIPGSQTVISTLLVK